jgi:hypothetical protein
MTMPTPHGQSCQGPTTKASIQMIITEPVME